MDILNIEEKDILKRVKTTKDEAMKIHKRNKRLLEIIQDVLMCLEEKTLHQKYTSNIDDIVTISATFFTGCPHCKVEYPDDESTNPQFDCENCSWTKALLEACEDGSPLAYETFHSNICLNKNSCPCIRMTFDSISLIQAPLISYGCFNEKINIHIPEWWLTDEFLPKKIQVFKDTITFLQGHIQWAQAILDDEIKNW